MLFILLCKAGEKEAKGLWVGMDGERRLERMPLQRWKNIPDAQFP
jgi:hypothetical protein